MDHADAGGDRLGGRAEGERFAVDEDLALVGGVQPVEHVHQGALAGAVLAEQGDELALGDGEVRPSRWR